VDSDSRQLVSFDRCQNSKIYCQKEFLNFRKI
jgi:hypothetical protein